MPSLCHTASFAVAVSASADECTFLHGFAVNGTVPSFYRLGHMAGGPEFSRALGISRDGRVVVGTCQTVLAAHAWRCPLEAVLSVYPVPPISGGDHVLEDLGVVSAREDSSAVAASDMMWDPPLPTGAVVGEQIFDWGGSQPVGNLQIEKVPYAVEWFAPAMGHELPGYVGIPDFGSGLTDIRATGVSRDGLILVGYGCTRQGSRGFLLDLTDSLLPVVVPVAVATPSAALRTSVVEALSADGCILAGYGLAPEGTRAFVTTVTMGREWGLESEILPVMAGGRFAEARAMTADGSVIVGRSDTEQGPQACLWYRDRGGGWMIRQLGGLAVGEQDSTATCVAYREGVPGDEVIVVGRVRTGVHSERAFVWMGRVADPSVGWGLVKLERLLDWTQAQGWSGAEWALTEATGISEDGRRIVGWGVNAGGGVEGWAVTAFAFAPTQVEPGEEP